MLARSPTSLLLFGPPTPLPPSASASVFPCRGLPSGQVLFLCGARGPATARAHLHARSVCEDGSPAPRCSGFSFWRGSGLPGYWAVLFMRAANHDTPPGAPSSRPLSRTALLSSCCTSPWTPDISNFRGCTQRLNMLARLRINAIVADDAARLATDLPGSALVGRVLHPLDDFSEFRCLPHPISFRTSRAWSLPCTFHPREGRAGLCPGLPRHLIVAMGRPSVGNVRTDHPRQG